MLVKTNLDEKLKYRKVEELVDLPTIIRVNQFTEESATTFYNDFQKAANTKQPVIPIVIDSYGGYVHSLLLMTDLIKTAEVPVATITIGKAMSCGVLLHSFGTEGYRFATENATFMIHDVSSGSWGKVEEIKADAKETDRLNDLVYSMLDSNCKKPAGYFKSLVHNKGHADWFLTPMEAYKHNLVNHIKMPKFNINVSVDIDFV